MKWNKMHVIYIVSVLLLLVTFSNRRPYNIGEPGFYVPVIIVLLVIGIAGVYVFGKNMRLYKNMYFISYLLTVGAALVPVLGVYIEDSSRSYGFPAEWFFYHSLSGSVSFNLIGFVFNFFVFYFFLRLLKQTLLSFSKNSGKQITV
ncbi:hypothetical protein [Alteribacter natronophilus]|uniref:hypothetical protein n=1 Tax=Alteribacter natronophilus TaxID=2583810 RepID=UPI00110F0CEE|nr:hypothetical protein [Alteribacter natronophilus]TMW70917.1 hypothetical protein FGB90_13150 [Alteribacter natronophilus]